jgi:hypothetical protein
MESVVNPNAPITYQIVIICFVVTSIVITVMMWIFSRFQTKRDAFVTEKQLRMHILKVESDVEKMGSDLARISENVSYIRGRLEPRPHIKET